MMPTMTKKKAASGKNKYPVLSVRAEDRIRQAVKQLAKQERRTNSKMAEILLEEALSLRGFLPPEVSSSPSDSAD